MQEFLSFRKMITPMIIQILFWVLVAACVISALVSFGQGAVLAGLVILILGPVFVRVYCELMILLFKIYDELKRINSKSGTSPE